LDSHDFGTLTSVKAGQVRSWRSLILEEPAMQKMISIGKFSKLTELSVRTLRLYDELSVLRPAFIDPDTNYRNYNLDQVGTAQQIRALRGLGLSLPKIRLVMREPHEAQEQLQLHRRELRGKLEAIQSKLEVLRRMIAA
jgi:DNA-binding transcriptional MerR regulator